MLLPFSLQLNPLLSRMEDVEVIVVLANHNKIPLLKIQANTKIKIITQVVEVTEVEEEEEGMGQEEDKLQPLQVNLKVGIDFVSGAETLLLSMMLTIPSNNALIIRKLEKTGGNINSKHLPLNLQIPHLKTQPLRETSKESI